MTSYITSLFPIPIRVGKKARTSPKSNAVPSHQSRKKGSGLGIKNLRTQNTSLLMKWLCRFNSEDSALGKRVVTLKYFQLNEWYSNIEAPPKGDGNLENNQSTMAQLLPEA